MIGKEAKMDVAQVVEMTFVLLQAEWDVEKSRQLVEQVKSTHVIVHRSDPQHYYHLYARQEALDRLAGAPSRATVHPMRAEFTAISWRICNTQWRSWKRR
jgi:hypothetical protein